MSTGFADRADRSGALLAALLDRLRRKRLRVWSLVISFYGDAILPRGGSLWLGNLTQVVTALDVNEGALRTAMSRLASDGWLERTRLGRNSFYRLAEKGRATFASATEHIYQPPQTPWTGHLQLAILAGDADREPARAKFKGANFGSPLPGLWVAPDGSPLPDSAGAQHLRAAADTATAAALAASAWPLERTAARYKEFIDTFEPFGEHVASGGRLSAFDSVLLRLLLIHDYRRIILHDPILPTPLLPPSWPAAEARRLCGRIYQAVLPSSESWLDENAVAEHGRLPPPDASVFRRFRTGPQDSG